MMDPHWTNTNTLHTYYTKTHKGESKTQTQTQTRTHENPGETIEPMRAQERAGEHTKAQDSKGETPGEHRSAQKSAEEHR